jgi:putative transposase
VSTLEYQLLYRRHLPHIQPPGATLFLTSRLADSLSPDVVDRLRAEAAQLEAILERVPEPDERVRHAYVGHRRLFDRWDGALGRAQTGRFWLRDPRIAAMVSECLHHRDGRIYDLDAFCIMPNHVHIVFTPLPKSAGTFHSMSAIMHSLKRYTARQANLLLAREGKFWQHENYDHMVRDEAEWARIISYVVLNPVVAGLVRDWRDWDWTYCKHPW